MNLPCGTAVMVLPSVLTVLLTGTFMSMPAIEISSLEKAGASFSLKVTLTCFGAAIVALAVGFELTTLACAMAGAAGARAATVSAMMGSKERMGDPYSRVRPRYPIIDALPVNAQL